MKKEARGRCTCLYCFYFKRPFDSRSREGAEVQHCGRLADIVLALSPVMAWCGRAPPIRP
jgi:hypothetical protein